MPTHKSYFVLFGVGLLALFFASASEGASAQYTASTDELYNPGRGWYTEFEMDVPGGDPLDAEELAGVRDGTPKQSLLLRIYWLVGNATTKFSQGAKLPTAFLQTMSADFDTIRQAGMKAIIRFGYTHVLTNENGPFGDASLTVASSHIDQISPILKANADVIHSIQAGFIGVWGEWYYTDHYGGVGASDNPDRKKLIDKLMAATSSSTSIAIRTPYYKYQLLNRTAHLTESEAYSGSTYARLGFHDDCFVASNDDQGTYIDPSFDYPYLGNETKYLDMGGETCEKVTRSSCYTSDGGAAMTELASFHWKYLNLGYHPEVIQTWKDEGCFGDITNRLGYRLLLSPSANHTYTEAVRPGHKFSMSLVIENVGFAAPLHKVAVYLLFIDQSVVYAKLPVDPRFWIPEESPVTLAFTLGVGQDVSEGNYSVALMLADALITSTPSDQPQPRYSIRLANEGTWNEADGYNDLGMIVRVSSSAPDTGEYAGELWIGSSPSSAGMVNLPSVAGALLVLLLVPFLLY